MSIQYMVPQPLEHELSPTTTRPGYSQLTYKQHLILMIYSWYLYTVQFCVKTFRLSKLIFVKYFY